MVRNSLIIVSHMLTIKYLAIILSHYAHKTVIFCGSSWHNYKNTECKM